jgi:3-methyladenine DNA glycosylase AlkD
MDTFGLPGERSPLSFSSFPAAPRSPHWPRHSLAPPTACTTGRLATEDAWERSLALGAAPSNRRGSAMSGRRPASERTAEVDRVAELLKQLEEIADRSRLAGMARYGISTTNALGVSIPELRRLARAMGIDHDRALALWTTRVHEARILASTTDEVQRVTPSQMDAWASEFDSWDLCDQVCGNLFDRTPHAFRMARAWSARRSEFVRRAGFATMACAAVHRKKKTSETSRSTPSCRRPWARRPTNGTT